VVLKGPISVQRTECKYGHALTPDNIYWHEHEGKRPSAECRRCIRDRKGTRKRIRRIPRHQWKVTKRTHCKFGHSWSKENTVITIVANRPTRRCRACANRGTLASYHRQKYDPEFAANRKTASRQWIDTRRLKQPTYFRDKWLKNTYGLSLDEFYEMLAAQKYKCAICSIPIDEFTRHIDHDHDTRLIRGLLCARCNHGLGHFRDSINILQSAAKYLARAQTLEALDQPKDQSCLPFVRKNVRKAG
jgi:hypothetical protein